MVDYGSLAGWLAGLFAIGTGTCLAAHIIVWLVAACLPKQRPKGWAALLEVVLTNCAFTLVPIGLRTVTAVL